ncbi:MAG: hypothetical protein U0R80_20525 [Nocardioidaceae bacterium]
MMMDWYGGGGWGPWIAMAAIMLGFWGVVLGAIAIMFRASSERRDATPPRLDHTEVDSR